MFTITIENLLRFHEHFDKKNDFHEEFSLRLWKSSIYSYILWFLCINVERLHLEEKRSCKFPLPSWILSCGQRVSSSFQVSSFKKCYRRCTNGSRVRPGPQKPWKSLNFSFQNLRPQKSLNFTKNRQGPWKVLKFSLLYRFHFVWFRVEIVYWKITYEAWVILFMFILAGCLDLRCVSMQGLIGSAAKTLPNLPPCFFVRPRGSS